MVSALGARDEREVTFDVAKQHVIAEYEIPANTVGNSGDSVLKTVARVSTCFFCRKPNHQKKDYQKDENWFAKKNGDDGNSKRDGK